MFLRAFGVLQSRFAVVRYPALTWPKANMFEVMNCYVILDNMIIESERNDPAADTEAYYRQDPLAYVDHQVPATCANFLAMRQEIRDPVMHTQLQNDRMEHLWRRKGNGNADA